MPKKERSVYTLKEAADYLRYSTKTVRGFLRDGKIEHFRLGRSYRITADALTRMENSLSFKTRRNFESDIGLIESSYKNIWILGINALSPLHRGFEIIKKKMSLGVDVRLLLLDPNSEAFMERANHEADGREEYTISRLKSEFEATIAICKCLADSIGRWGICGKIDVRLHSEEPHGSMILIDYLSGSDVHWLCNYNPYPYGKGMRGISGKTISIDNKTESDKTTRIITETSQEKIIQVTPKKTRPEKKMTKVEMICTTSKMTKKLGEYKNEYENLFESATPVKIYENLDLYGIDLI